MMTDQQGESMNNLKHKPHNTAQETCKHERIALDHLGYRYCLDCNGTLLESVLLQAIVTKYIPPTNTRDARVKATCAAGSHTIDWNDNLDIDTNHQIAAYAIRAKFNWNNQLIGGTLRDGQRVWTQIPTKQ
jgi:hypothetical protein